MVPSGYSAFLDYSAHLAPSSAPSLQVTSSGGRHMAVNYWWKPPGWKDTIAEEKRLKYRLLTEMKAESDAKRAKIRSEEL
jgi:hypothetical protein